MSAGASARRRRSPSAKTEDRHVALTAIRAVNATWRVVLLQAQATFSCRIRVTKTWRFIWRWSAHAVVRDQNEMTPCVWPQTMENMKIPKCQKFKNCQKSMFAILLKIEKSNFWDFTKNENYILQISKKHVFVHVFCMFKGCLRGFTTIGKCWTSQKKIGDHSLWFLMIFEKMCKKMSLAVVLYTSGSKMLLWL